MPQTNSIRCEKSKESVIVMSIWMTVLSKYWIQPMVHFCFYHEKKKKKVFGEKVEALFCYIKSFDNISETMYNP